MNQSVPSVLLICAGNLHCKFFNTITKRCQFNPLHWSKNLNFCSITKPKSVAFSNFYANSETCFRFSPAGLILGFFTYFDLCKFWEFLYNYMQSYIIKHYENASAPPFLMLWLPSSLLYKNVVSEIILTHDRGILTLISMFF